MKKAPAVDSVGAQDSGVPETTPARHVEPKQSLVRWDLLWSSFKSAFPLVRFVVLFGGAWFFGLHDIATLYLGDYLVKPTAACMAGLLRVIGNDPAWTTPVNGVAVRLGIGTSSLWIGAACTPIGPWMIWLVFLLGLPIGWRIRAIALAMGLAALWILNTARLSSVLLLDADGRHDLAKVVHDQVWPWLIALMVVAGAWAYLRRRWATNQQLVQTTRAGGGE